MQAALSPPIILTFACTTQEHGAAPPSIAYFLHPDSRVCVCYCFHSLLHSRIIVRIGVTKRTKKYLSRYFIMSSSALPINSSAQAVNFVASATFPSPTMEPYRHTRLNDEQDEIRLFQILYDQQPGLTCSLQTFELNKCPEYVALSYEWGPPETLESITVAGTSLSIRINLWHCLKAIRAGLKTSKYQLPTSPLSRAIRQDREGMYIWCDQVCIDQTHLQERNHQVGMMRKIYSSAVEVLAWLGPENTLNAFDASTIDNDLCGESRTVKELPGLHVDNEQPGLFSTLGRRSYFSRLWVVQELMFSQEVHFICGLLIMDWDTVSFMAAGRRLPEAMQDMFRLKPRVQRGDTSLSEIIGTFGGLRCEDLRDKIFGLLGLVAEPKRFAVDYFISSRDLFFEVVSKIFTDEPKMRNMRYAHDLSRFTFGLRRLLELHNGAVSDQELWDVIP